MAFVHLHAHSYFSFYDGTASVEQLVERAAKLGMPAVALTDFESGRRDEVISYAMEKHPDHAAMVATVSRFRARSAVREIGRAMGHSYEKLGELTRSFNYYLPASKIREAIAVLPELRDSELGTEPYRELVDICSRIDNFPRHLSVHLGGLVITDEPVVSFSPLLPSHKGWPVLSFDKDDVEDLGLIKTDILGLRMLGAIASKKRKPKARDLLSGRHREHCRIGKRLSSCFPAARFLIQSIS